MILEINMVVGEANCFAAYILVEQFCKPCVLDASPLVSNFSLVIIRYKYNGF